MNEKKMALARRAVACPGWRWMPGMRTLDRWRVVALHALGDGVLRGWNEDVWRDGIVPNGLAPDLDDPATLGCLLALVREAWDDPNGFVDPISENQDGSAFVVWIGNCGIAGGSTEVEALVFALEAARG